MSVDSKEIELIIRANNQSKQTLDGVSKSISELNGIIEQQGVASKKGAVGIDELRATTLQLQQAQEKLKGQANLVTQFERSGEAAEKAATRVVKAKEAYDKFSTSNKGIADDGSVTEARAEKLAKLTASVARAEAAEARRTATNAKLAAQLREVGIDETNLVGVESTLRQSAAELGLSIGRASVNVADFTVNLNAAKRAAKELAETETFLIQSAAATKRAKDAEYVNMYTEALLRQEAAMKHVADTEAFLAQASNATKRAKDVEYERMYTDLLLQRDAAMEKIAAKSAVTKMADDAEKAARAFTTLAGSATESTPKITGLFDTLRGISDPVSAARQSMVGLEDETRKLGTTISAIDGPVKNYRETMQSLEAVQKQVGNQGASIDAYRQQMMAVTQARQAFVQARTDVAAVAAAMRQADQPTQQLSNEMKAAQTNLANAANSMRNSVSAARDMRTELGRAGIDTHNLAGAEQRLIGMTRENTASVQGLSEAYSRYGAAANRATNETVKFGDGGRTALSLLQRMRGELLSVTAGYLGLQAAISGVKSVIDTTVEKQAMENRLGIVVGNDPKKIGDEYAYIHDQSMRLGMGMKDMSAAYSKFAIDAKQSNLSIDGTKFVFERLTEAMRVNHASAEATGHAFEQFGQMLGKTKVQMDDLKQAGNWLPGLRTTMAKGLLEMNYAGIGDKNPVADMMALMKKGGVDAGIALHAVAVQMQKDYAEQLPEALKGLQAEQGRFQTKVMDFKVLVSEAGFGKAYTDFLRHLQDLMGGDKSDEFAKKISDGLTDVLNILTKLIDNIGLVKDALILCFMIKGSEALMAFAAGFPLLMTRMAQFNIAIDASTTKMGLLHAACNLLIAAFVGWEIGTYLSEKFAVVQWAGTEMVRDLLVGFEFLKAGFAVVMEAIKTIAVEGFASIEGLATLVPRKLMEAAKKLAEAGGKTDLAASIGQGIDALTVKTDGLGAGVDKVKKIWSDMGVEVAKINKTTGEMKAESAARMAKDGFFASPDDPNKPKVVTPGMTTADPGEPDALPIAAKVDKKRENLLQTITNEIAQMQAMIDKRETDSIDAQMKVFDDKATGLIAKIHKLGGAEAAKFAGQVAGLISQLKTQAEEKYMAALDKSHDTAMDKVNSATDQMAKSFEQRVRAKLDAVRKQFKAAGDDIDAYEKKLQGSTHNGAAPPAEQTAEIAKWRTELAARQGIVEAQATSKAAEEAITEKGKEVNKLLETRKDLLAIIKLSEKAGDITPVEAIAQQKAIIDQMQPKIKAMADSAIAYAKTMGTALKPEDMAKFTAQMHLAEKSSDGLRQSMYTVADAEKDLTAGAMAPVKALGEGIAKAAMHAGTLKGAFQSAGVAFLKFASDFMLKIAEMIIQEKILAAIKSSGAAGGLAGMFGGAAAGGAAATAGGGAAMAGGADAASMGVEAVMVAHSGAVVGQPGGTSRNASHSWFDNAPKYHTGGVVGLQADEYPAILKKNEEVVTADNPRNVLNGGGKTTGGNVKMPDLKIINAIDSGSMVQAGLSSTTGQKAFYNFLQANKSQVKTLLG